MGKRKERRLAALNSVGRRVKLDLFAEPSDTMVVCTVSSPPASVHRLVSNQTSGEYLGGSSTQEEDGGVLDFKCLAELPNSPSSSGQQPDNPLFLLGQYSDDEIHVESNKRLEAESVESPLTTDGLEVRESAAEKCKKTEVNSVVEFAAQAEKKLDAENDSISQDALHNLNGNNGGDIDCDAAGPSSKELISTEEVCVYGTSDLLLTADAHSAWKMVLHEESQQYYYWNTETGETSWVVPGYFAQKTELVSEHKAAPVSPGRDAPLLDNYKLGPEMIKEHDYSHIYTTDTTNFVSQTGELYLHDTHLSELNQVFEGDSFDAKIFGAELIQNGHDESCAGTSGFDKCMAGHVTSSECRDGADLCVGLIEHGDSLLKRLNLLRESKDYLQGKDWASKYITETEVRLSDVRALLSHGSSLLPFWEYSERQLKQLEGAIDDEINQSAKKINVIEAPDATSTGEDNKLIESTTFDNGTNSSSFPEHSVPPKVVQSPPFQIDPPNNSIVIASSGNLNPHLEGNADEKIIDIVLPTESSPKSTFNTVEEDMDMDVDMEVEDASPTNNHIIKNSFGIGHFPLDDDGLIVPPPPDEEWIPPPPPDSELIPPPPPPDVPDEPYIYPVLPSYIPQFPHAEPYQLSYSNSNFQILGQAVSEVDGRHVDVPSQEVYYEMVPNTYLNTSSDIVNHGGLPSIFKIEDGVTAPVPEASAVSSGFIVESWPVIYSGVLSNQSGSLDVNPTENVKTDYSALSTVSNVESLDAPMPSLTASMHAVERTSLKENDSMVNFETSVTSVDGTSTTAKIGSKVSRSKKRAIASAPTLRSNKKVSKLLDKWKAAKEELDEEDEDEDDDEPENAYENLEKKRQKGIEVWHAQQIASGDARDNANFQPLGGDWRERVKRRRAAREALQQGESVDKNQLPNLLDLSRDLPHGWQAFWDESSKQVYYGNATTSETSWIKPTI